MAYVVYRAGPDDVEDLARLLNAAFADGLTSDHDTLLEQTGKGTFLCLRDDDELIGCVFVRAEDGWAALDSLSVAPGKRALGFGSLLLERAEAWTRRQKLKGVRLHVLSPRAELISWYERRGYTRGQAAVPAVELEKVLA